MVINDIAKMNIKNTIKFTMATIFENKKKWGILEMTVLIHCFISTFLS